MRGLKAGDENTGDFYVPPAPVNALLSGMLGLESSLVAAGVNMPLGSSLLCLAVKPATLNRRSGGQSNSCSNTEPRGHERCQSEGTPRWHCGGQMWRWARRILASIVGLPVIALLAGTSYQAWVTSRTLSASPPPGRLVDVGGHRLHIWCTGSGVPTVLLDSGLGGMAFDWSHVQPRVAAFTHVCSYDRAGMGYSDPGPRPRTSEQIVRELAALLDRSGVPGRVIFVGASIGGWNVRLFASTHSERAAGLVLVDARHENQGEQLAAAGAPEHPPPVAHVAPLVAYSGIARLFGIAPGLPPSSFAPDVRQYAQATRFRSSALATAASELLSGRDSAAQVRAARRELDIPLVVVSAGRRDTHTAAVLSALQRDQLGLSRRSCQVIAERSGHGIAIAQPEIVVDAIRAIVEAAADVARVPDCSWITQRSLPPR